MGYSHAGAKKRTARVKPAAAAGTAIILFLLTACTGTKLVAQWKDDIYTGRPAKVFVICTLEDRGPKTLVEDEFVRQFKARGISAVASYTVFPAGPRPTKEEVLDKVKEQGADSVIVVKFLRKEMGGTHTPVRRYAVPQGFATSWDSYAGMGVTTDVGIRDVSYDYDVITAETTLYQTSTGSPIWSAMSETTYQGGALKQIKPFSVAIMKGLVHAKIVP
jgi:hypothetical protein